MTNSLRMDAAVAEDADADTFVQAALIEVSASVSVTYELQ